MTQTDSITGYHAHIYFDAATVDQARGLCQQAAERFSVEIGRVHEKNVGPHPMWSCQLAATPDQFAQLLPWLALNRNGLVVFAHPETGDALADHRDHGIWLGTGLELDLSIFN
ncbi:DOPA 4,5-dioxygenase family protein [Leisingera sp. McT4-56]|uniref:DOPA 4,5-dioxygenase family protein n=1 Tax=Leisingera sp. McT4-56 TaxID=2881255 RepID=UPI001CF8211C|nr:DOPA 4,5-dioxygenase family protein [Leisingera sp. McT4-56]MCB4455544.1 DOPA 4,5-dioxygenase family protein [Leisingera sp. McT4-56]